MRILVTGGLGTIGRPLVAELRRQGHSVVACDLYHSGEPYYYRCDVAEWRQWERLFESDVPAPFDLVYHAAAEFGRRNGEEYYEQLWRTNVIGTKHLIRLQERFGFKMVFFSSSEIYGERALMLSEDLPDRAGTKPLNDYAISKWTSELQIANSIRQFGARTVTVRLFNVYGPGEYYTPYRSAVCQFIHAALTKSPITVYAGNKRSFLYVDDCIRTLTRLAERFNPGAIYNVASTDVRTMQRISELVLDAVGVDDSHIRYDAMEAGNAAGKHPSVDRAVRDLGHDPRVDLVTGIARTVEWQRSIRRPLPGAEHTPDRHGERECFPVA